LAPWSANIGTATSITVIATIANSAVSRLRIALPRRGHPTIPREHEEFGRGFFAEEYVAELGFLWALGLQDDTDEEEA
jgi:hypothetical protein